MEARQLQGKCQKQNFSLYATFVDLTTVFDTISNDGLWKIMNKFGCPDRFITLARQFHYGMLDRVQDDVESSHSFLVTNGVKQDYVIAPTLFSMMILAILTDTFCDGDNEIALSYQFDGKPWNLQRLQARTKVHIDIIHALPFANDCALNAVTQSTIQES